MRRTLIIVVVVIAVIGALAYAANTFDLAGLIARAHTPPAH
jgi:hypothetical protein